MPQRIWNISTKHSDDLISQLLFNRGLKTSDEIEEFLNPKLESYESVFKIPGIPNALKRIEKAIKDNEQIVVFGDYDVDGVCSSAIVYLALSSLGAKVIPYIPHREKEGYGMSKVGLDNVRELGASLVITVDNGIVALEQSEYAKSLGMELIITDHHEPLDKKPSALAIVHTTELCGAGVAWCLIRSLVSKKLSEELLQFVAIATVCDLVPLIGANRALVKKGIKILNQTENLGLKALLTESGVKLGEIGTYEIGYMIGPRLNAVGRLEHAIDALRLLCTKNIKKAKEIAQLLSGINSKRQKLTMDGVDGARVMVNKSRNIHVLYSPEWMPGVIGLIAGRICEEESKPVIAIAVGEEISKGSARSVKGVNIIETLRECSDILMDVGGHSKAAGFTIETKRIGELEEKLERILKDKRIDFTPILEIEAEVEKEKLTKKLAKELEEFEPLGLGNPRPILCCKGIQIRDIRTVGEGKHLKLKADNIEVIGFGMGGLLGELKEGSMVDLAFYLEINKFNGSENLQLKLKDILVNN